MDILDNGTEHGDHCLACWDWPCAALRECADGFWMPLWEHSNDHLESEMCRPTYMGMLFLV